MRALTLGLSALACTVALVATTATSAIAEPHGQRNWKKAEGHGYRDHHHGYGYRRYGGPYIYYGPGPYYYDPYYDPYYYAPAPYYGSSVSFSFGF
jgi:hypothetical protein